VCAWWFLGKVFRDVKDVARPCWIEVVLYKTILTFVSDIKRPFTDSLSYSHFYKTGCALAPAAQIQLVFIVII